MSGEQALFGRDRELATLRDLIGTPGRLPALATIAGPAGIGKTALWLAGVEAARAAGYRVLSSRPAEAEARFSFAGLRDLLGGVLPDVSPRLPVPQRQALETALALSDVAGGPADEAVVALGFLSALRILASGGPVLIALDDVQWLDEPSQSIMQFALARLTAEPVAIVATARDAVPAWLRRELPGLRSVDQELGPMSVGALYELLRVRLGAVYPRPTLLRIWETSGGNAFFALELARALQRRGGRIDPGHELPIPGTLDELVEARFAGLGTSGQEVARVVAALGDPTPAVVKAAVGDAAEAGLAEAIDAGIIELDGRRLRFSHPLLGTAVSAATTPARRRALHARLATLVAEPEERARHLALATPEANAEVAAEVEAAARNVRARGAAAAAADLGELAVRLTPAEDAEAHRRRLVDAAGWHLEAGDGGRAIALLEQALALTPSGLARAAVLTHLARAVKLFVSPREAIPRDVEALAEAGDDDALSAQIHLDLADAYRLTGDRDTAIAHAEEAIEAATRADEPLLLCAALSIFGAASFSRGRGIPRERMDQALAIERSMPDWAVTAPATQSLVHQLVWSGDLDRARQLITEWRAGLEGLGHHEETRALWHAALLEWRAGNWELAARHAADSLTLRAQFSRLGGQPISEFPAAGVAAHRGQLEEAEAISQRALAEAEREGVTVARSGHDWILGFVKLSRGDVEAALPHLERSNEIRESIGVVEPGQCWELGDLLEALVSVGRLDEAEAKLRPWEASSRHLDRSWGLAIAARCRALLFAARGDQTAAQESFDRALAEHARTQDPYQHARTLLAMGAVQRRAKRRSAARAAFNEAIAIFDRLGATAWSGKARSELGRIGGRVRSSEDLTEGERQIATLVAQGRTNREVAAALFVTEHTVEAALTRAYRKLEVRSRGELAARLSGDSLGADARNL